MGNIHSLSTESALRPCLTGAVPHVAFPDELFYQLRDAQPWNLNIPVLPAAVTYPETSDQVAAVIRCAAENDFKVQAKSGGHSYGNYGLGGDDGAVVINLKKFQQFSMNQQTWQATIGSGTLLGDVTKRLHNAGARAMAHGTCPSVGIGGHATIGGLGPTSRLWGTSLDHVEEVEVVLANSTITRASQNQNSDLFFALRGAAASFGVITEFKVRTEPAPGEIVQYSFGFTYDSYATMAYAFKLWQQFVSAPELTAKFATQVVISKLGMVISGTYFGSKAEFDNLKFNDIFFHAHFGHVVVLDDWLGVVANWATDVALLLGTGEPAAMFSKSLTFNTSHLIPSPIIDDLFNYFDTAKRGSSAWFAIFDLEGGAVNDVQPDATAYAHRDAIFYLQSYAVEIGASSVSESTKDFIRGINNVITDGMPGVNLGAYAGYVDPELGDKGPAAYWGTNLPRLEQLKRKYDPEDIFHNPQSVRPAVSAEITKQQGEKQKGLWTK